MELTRALRASTLTRKTPLLPGLTAGKTACHSPAAATAGFFSESHLEQPHNGLHLYRRMPPRECFVASVTNFLPRLSNVSFRHPGVFRQLACPLLALNIS